MTSDDIARLDALVARLRELAGKATPGPWSTRAERNCPRAIVIAGTEQIADAGEHTHWTDEQCAGNAAWIAAANPSAITEILDAVAKLREESEVLSGARHMLNGAIAALRARCDVLEQECREREVAAQQLTEQRDEARAGGLSDADRGVLREVVADLKRSEMRSPDIMYYPLHILELRRVLERLLATPNARGGER